MNLEKNGSSHGGIGPPLGTPTIQFGVGFATRLLRRSVSSRAFGVGVDVGDGDGVGEGEGESVDPNKPVAGVGVGVAIGIVGGGVGVGDGEGEVNTIQLGGDPGGHAPCAPGLQS